MADPHAKEEQNYGSELEQILAVARASTTRTSYIRQSCIYPYQTVADKAASSPEFARNLEIGLLRRTLRELVRP
jgi:hypothetical protein